MVASIPSPSFNSIDIGPLSLNLYGLMIALGVIAAVWLFGKRLEEREVGTKDDASAIAIWAVARRRHRGPALPRRDRLRPVPQQLERDPCDLERRARHPGRAPVRHPVVGMYIARRRGIPIAVGATCAAPAIPLAQAIGRWGNYFNQELYGRPPRLPWGLRIDPRHFTRAATRSAHRSTRRSSTNRCGASGCAWCCSGSTGAGGPAPGQLFVMYIMGYGLGRFWVEGLRIDTAHRIGGLRHQRVGRLRCSGDRRHRAGVDAAPPDRRTGARTARSTVPTPTSRIFRPCPTSTRRFRVTDDGGSDRTPTTCPDPQATRRAPVLGVEQVDAGQLRCQAHPVAGAQIAQPVGPARRPSCRAVLRDAVEERLGSQFLDELDRGVEPAGAADRRDRSDGRRS